MLSTLTLNQNFIWLTITHRIPKLKSDEMTIYMFKNTYLVCILKIFFRKIFQTKSIILSDSPWEMTHKLMESVKMYQQSSMSHQLHILVPECRKMYPYYFSSTWQYICTYLYLNACKWLKIIPVAPICTYLLLFAFICTYLYLNV